MNNIQVPQYLGSLDENNESKNTVVQVLYSLGLILLEAVFPRTASPTKFAVAVSLNRGTTFHDLNPTVFSGLENPATDVGFCCD
jgi:hypothetical protein